MTTQVPGPTVDGADPCAWGVPDALRQLLAVPTGSGPLVVAVDGRSGAGKTTLATALAEATGAARLATDDIAWHQPLFAWGPLLREALATVRSGQPLELRPASWQEHGRPGAIRVPAHPTFLVVEGVGSSQRDVADLVDVVVWVECDRALARTRGIARDVASGVNGDEAEATRFWDEWTAAEEVFLAQDRPWERADTVVEQALGGGWVVRAPAAP